MPGHLLTDQYHQATDVRGKILPDILKQRGALPPWYSQSVNAPTFLLPLLLKGSPFGLIYADKAEPGELQLGETELALLRTLRSQAVMAFWPSS